MAIGIYGGSFDPIHIGHLITTQVVMEKRNLEKVIFIPNHISPLKQESNPADDIHRLNMVKLAIESFNKFEVSDIEIVKGSISYTINTIKNLRKNIDELELIIGFDNLLVFDKWFMPEEILSLAKVIVMKRQTDILPSHDNTFFNRVVFVDTPVIEISSSEIRNRINKNKSIDFFVPQNVKEYIYQNGLYK